MICWSCCFLICLLNLNKKLILMLTESELGTACPKSYIIVCIIFILFSFRFLTVYSSAFHCFLYLFFKLYCSEINFLFLPIVLAAKIISVFFCMWSVLVIFIFYILQIDKIISIKYTLLNHKKNVIENMPSNDHLFVIYAKIEKVLV